MDDFSDVKIWEDLRRFLPCDGFVLITTRSTEMARYANSDSSSLHWMNFLNQHESRILLYDRVFGEDDCPIELRGIVDEIVQICKGFPLALVVIGGLLSKIGQNEENWNSVVKSLKSIDPRDDECMEILALSYYRLPHHLRPCFLYMGMFPKDYEVPITKLVRLWAAEGFLQEFSRVISPEKLAEEYLEDLVQRRLILVCALSSQGQIKTCKIHDVLRKLCLREARKERFLFVINRQQDVRKGGIESYQRLIIRPDMLEIHPDILYGEVHRNSRTHSLLCIGSNLLTLEHSTVNYLHHRLLRVLDLLIIYLATFPLEVSDIVSLRYLALSFTGEFHPRISRLQNLQTIIHNDASSHKDSVLPEEIWMIPNLRHLHVPPTGLCSSSSLRTNSTLQTLAEVINLSFNTEIVGMMASLKKLVVSYDVELQSFQGWLKHKLQNLVGLLHLENLKLQVINSMISSKVSYPWNLDFPLSLKKLTLSGCRIPWERLVVVGVLPNLLVLKLRDSACQGEEWVLIEGQFLNLTSLELQNLDLVHWRANDIHFPCLQCLVVKSCHQLEEIPLGISSMPTLQRIEVIDCHYSVVSSAKKNEQQSLKDLLPTSSKSRPYFGAPAGKNAVVGMGKDLEELKEKLCGTPSNLEIIPIVGMGGIGKTTLAAQVYNDNVIRNYFDTCAWVTVSQVYSFCQVMLDLLNAANPRTKGIYEECDEIELGILLYKELGSRRYLIVMDDVWDPIILDKVIRFLPHDMNRSRVLLTTRSMQVAHHAKSGGYIHHMHFLNENESLSLLCSGVFGENGCPDELRKLGFEIVQRCEGLPLAIVVLGGLLSSKPRENWRSFADGVRLDTIGDNVLMDILALSYNHLPHYLRPCFLYMGMFPENYEVSVTKLTHLWAAEGFLQQSKSFESLEKISTEYLEDLVGRSLILVSHRNSQGKIKRCKIHNILRELCLHVAHKEKFFGVINGQEKWDGTESYQRLVLHPNIMRVRPNIMHDEVHRKSSIHSLLCMGSNFNDTGDKIQFNFLHYELLRVLDLLIIQLSTFPLEVCNLISLRYLALSFTGMLHPHISRLGNLQTIVHRDPSSFHSDSKLPVEIWMMPNLRHLYVPATCLSSPTSGNKDSFNLQTLVEVINLSFRIQILDKIKTVKKLAVCYNEMLQSFGGWKAHELENLVQLNQLEKLKLRVINSQILPCIRSRISYPQNIALPQSLKNLTLSGCRIPWECLKFVGALPNLEVLKLKDDACQGKKWKPIEGEFLKLMSLELQRLELVHWRADETSFPRLQHLTVKSCHRLKKIPLSIGNICTLQRIKVVDCHYGVAASVKYIQEMMDDYGILDFEANIYNSEEIKEYPSKAWKEQ